MTPEQIRARKKLREFGKMKKSNKPRMLKPMKWAVGSEFAKKHTGKNILRDN